MQTLSVLVGLSNGLFLLVEGLGARGRPFGAAPHRLSVTDERVMARTKKPGADRPRPGASPGECRP